MIISIASGKGGTGKTTIATSLAFVNHGSVYIDCDVEEPNGHILLHPQFHKEAPSTKSLPRIDYSKCNTCGKCAQVCEFHALINLGSEILLIDELCHACGTCEYLCPEKAISEVKKKIGVVREGFSAWNNIKFYDGVLNVGEASASPVIKDVKKNIQPDKLNIIDSPPGTSCSMVEAVKDSDFCILVTESSPFGLHDLNLAIEVLQVLKIPYGVVINKYEKSYTDLENYLNEQRINILMKIPFDKGIAVDYSNGEMPSIFLTKMNEEFKNIVK
ncbi:MAG: ATP-binding protein [Melioribacteraceae bacterium]|nr:ATP-binding protein [Melioribacteraceae bacterium]